MIKFRILNFIKITIEVIFMKFFNIIFIHSLSKYFIIINIGILVHAWKINVIKRILYKGKIKFGEGHFPERPSLGDFTEGCFGVLGLVGKYPQPSFCGNISFENPTLTDHCASCKLFLTTCKRFLTTLNFQKFWK